MLSFKATDIVKNNSHRLAIIESTQSAEVIFTLSGEIIILNGTMPGTIGFTGLLFIIIGMIVNNAVAD